MIAAQAAEAANLQGKYWQMHDLLYKDQSQWVDAPTTGVVSQFFDGYAQSLGMNVTKFNTDITASSTIARVQRDITSGTNAQIDHTPTFFINLKQIPNPDGYASFAALIDAALAASSTPAAATSTAK
jgi:protein-disulfide isomerase